MDNDLKEALEAIKGLRAALWLALVPDETKPAVMNDQERNAFLAGAAVLAKHNDPDDMMDVDMDSLTGGAS